eukprot:3555881-Amphidinium_carterae.1
MVCTDGSGHHSSNPHFRCCGVGYYTDTAWSHEECQPTWVVSDSKGAVVACLSALQAGYRQPKGGCRDLEKWALVAMPAFEWMKAHQMRKKGVRNRSNPYRSPGMANMLLLKLPWSGVNIGVTLLRLRHRSEQWPIVKLPAPELEPEVPVVDELAICSSGRGCALACGGACDLC